MSVPANVLPLVSEVSGESDAPDAPDAPVGSLSAQPVLLEPPVLKLDAELLDTPTAKAIAAALPVSSAVLTWGEEVYFDAPIGDVPSEKDARAVVTPGEVALWPGGPCIALGYGRTPISQSGETGLASPSNIFGKLIGDPKSLAKVKAGAKVTVSAV